MANNPLLLDEHWEPEIQTVPPKPKIQSSYTPEELFNHGSVFKATSREDIVGIDNVLAEIDDVIHWLKHSGEYAKYKSRITPGIVFEGAPGTGKTLCSRYIATASGALFVNVRDWPHKHVLMRDYELAELFAMARKTYRETKTPVVLFWDEFENAGWERSRANSDVQALVSQLTAELDGIHGKNEGILLIGCTNYIRGIDEALLRSGRMGLHIEFHAPDREGKRTLLTHYLSQYRVNKDIDIETLSHFFETGATAADIEEACVEAWRFAVKRAIENKRDNKGSKTPRLSQHDLVQVFLKRLVGPPTTFINLPEDDRFRIALHETGHALMALVYDCPLRLITVQPGKKSMGRTITAEAREHIGELNEYISTIRINLGSIAAEKVAGFPAMDGSTGDLLTANQIAAKLVDGLNYSRRSGIMNVGAIAGTRSYDYSIMSEAATQLPDQEIFELLNGLYEESVQAMETIGALNIHEIARVVNEKVTLTGAEFEELTAKVLGNDDFTRYQADSSNR